MNTTGPPETTAFDAHLGEFQVEHLTEVEMAVTLVPKGTALTMRCPHSEVKAGPSRNAFDVLCPKTKVKELHPTPVREHRRRLDNLHNVVVEVSL